MANTVVPQRVLVTRPAGQADTLLRLLSQAGFTALHQPALCIEPLPVSLPDASELARYPIILFVSSNAVHYFFAAGPTLSTQTRCFAVGPATAAALRQAGMPVEVPPQGFNSEALLALPQLQQVRKQPILLCRGEGGRPLLADVLLERGAQLDELVLYRRQCRQDFCWPGSDVAAVLISSVDSWRCIANQLPASCHIIAGSTRIADAIDAMPRITVARSPADQDMLAATRQALRQGTPE